MYNKIWIIFCLFEYINSFFKRFEDTFFIKNYVGSTLVSLLNLECKREKLPKNTLFERDYFSLRI